MAELKDPCRAESPRRVATATSEQGLQRLVVRVERLEAQHQADLISLVGRIEEIESVLSTLGTPLWKRFWFRVNGWPAWYINAPEPKHRPWHKWIKP